MGKFNKRDRSSGGGRFGNDRGFRKNDRSERPTMFRAVCSDCGRDCEVPFRPTGDKPVFCSSCFGEKKGAGSGGFEKRHSERANYREKQMFQAICDKCHKECEVPFKPSSDKPVYCSECFEKGSNNSRDNGAIKKDQYKKEFEILNNKLDDILKMLLSNTKVEKIAKEEKSTAVLTKKPTEKKRDIKKKEVTEKTTVSKKAALSKKTDKKTVKKVGVKKKSK